jgi:cell division transport system permease protein
MTPSSVQAKRSMLWKRALIQGWKQLVRERNWFLTVGTLTGVCMLFQLLLLSYIGIEGFTSILQDQTNLRLELNENVTPEVVSAFVSDLKALEYIDRVQLITPAKTYETMKESDPTLIAFLEEFNLGNPFPQTVHVQISSLNDYEYFTEQLQQEKWRSVLAPSFSTSTSEQETYIRQTIAVSTAISRAIIAFIALALVVLVYIIIELIRSKIMHKNEEIIIQRLCGAMHFYIVLPFVVEVSLILLLAVSLSIIVMLSVAMAAPFVFTSLSTNGILSQLWLRSSQIFTERVTVLVLIQLVCIPFVAWFGTWLGSFKILHNRYLGLHRH